MKKEIKKKLKVLLIVFIALTILLILLKLFGSKKDYSELKPLNEDYKYFSIQSTINSDINDDNKNYITTKILCKSHEETDYCFVGGYLIEYIDFSSPTYDDKIGYALVLKGNTYTMKQIETDNIETYANNYNKYEELKDGKVLPIIDYSEKNKLSSYISNFINLLMFDQSKAKLLISSNSTKSINELQSLSSNIISYEKEDNTYTILDSNNNRFKIIETSTMDYKIEL